MSDHAAHTPKTPAKPGPAKQSVPTPPAKPDPHAGHDMSKSQPPQASPKVPDKKPG